MYGLVLQLDGKFDACGYLLMYQYVSNRKIPKGRWKVVSASMRLNLDIQVKTAAVACIVARQLLMRTYHAYSIVSELSSLQLAGYDSFLRYLRGLERPLNKHWEYT